VLESDSVEELLERRGQLLGFPAFLLVLKLPGWRKSQWGCKPPPVYTTTVGLNGTARMMLQAASAVGGKVSAAWFGPRISMSAQKPGNDTTPASLPRPLPGLAPCTPMAKYTLCSQRSCIAVAAASCCQPSRSKCMKYDAMVRFENNATIPDFCPAKTLDKNVAVTRLSSPSGALTETVAFIDHPRELRGGCAVGRAS
jgi:hypothetical protein